MSKRKILLQLDTDVHASVFDAVVAIDAGIDHLLPYGGVTADGLPALVHGAMFTRGPADLAHTAIFIGGSRVEAGEALLAGVTQCFFGPFRVSVMLDANGANTTAAAAVLAAAQHLPLAGAHAVVLAGTGPVGQRAARLLARSGAQVTVASRSLAKAAQVASHLSQQFPKAQITAGETSSLAALQAVIDGASVVIAAGAAGAELLPHAVRQQARGLKVAIDLNAVPPAGIAGIEPGDKARQREGVVCFGALGVGGTKMKIHRAAISRLFESNSLVLDADEIFELGQTLLARPAAN